ncbi:hypothetical protein [Neobacillus sp. SuZ13]|uniref:hypothetical protein n=1 Tax=Neobacillus sp. SuZ13 TaxID=3047875 RepID=UPI0024C08B6C|nr:hypothetical protein [Neobacillus sp. SuZ13]WHY64681.1 hypothetical protein QNH17_16270 [Neobacillus sp. SuZ13]
MSATEGQFAYVIGVKYSDDPIRYIQDHIGNKFVNEVENALMFYDKNDAYKFEEKIKRNIGKQRNTTVLTYKVLTDEISKVCKVVEEV